MILSSCAALHSATPGACLPSPRRVGMLTTLRADDSGAETVLLLDDQTFEVMDRFQLDCAEARHFCERHSWGCSGGTWCCVAGQPLPRRQPPPGQQAPCARCCYPAP